jgi:flagellar hook-associated protein 3 FlgL
MIDLSNQMIYRIGNLNNESERISYQMSTGKVLENGSDDSVLYARYLDVENKLRDQEGLLIQIDKTVAQNNVSDSVIAEAKTTLENIKTDLLRGLNSGMTRSDREAVATNISGMRENLIRLANTQIDGEYIYAGSNTTKKHLSKMEIL